MRVSLNEIRTMAGKAAIGAGLPFGTADEIGHAAAWLAQVGQDAVGPVLVALTAAETAPPHPLEPSEEDGKLDLVAAAQDGAAVVDLLFARPSGQPLAIDRVDVPAMLIGLIGQALGRDARGGTVTVDLAGGDRLTVTAGCLLPCRGLRPGPGAVTLVLTRGHASQQARCPDGVEVDPGDWRALSALAARTLVPADGTSRRRGAGAGDIDNE